MYTNKTKRRERFIMIIELKFKNWTSFRDEECFVLAATQEKRLKNRLPKIRKSPVLNVSPIAALYGGNASGKTNFFKLLSFLKKMVVFPLYDESEDIPLETFKFDSDNKISEISLINDARSIGIFNEKKDVHYFEYVVIRNDSLKKYEKPKNYISFCDLSSCIGKAIKFEAFILNSFDKGDCFYLKICDGSRVEHEVFMRIPK